MAVYGQYDSRTTGSRLSVSSLVLLAVFVGAAALMVAIVVWRPGVKDGGGGLPPAQPEAQAPVAPAADAAAPAAPAAPEAAPSAGEAGPQG